MPTVKDISAQELQKPPDSNMVYPCDCPAAYSRVSCLQVSKVCHHPHPHPHPKSLKPLRPPDELCSGLEVPGLFVEMTHELRRCVEAFSYKPVLSELKVS